MAASAVRRWCAGWARVLIALAAVLALPGPAACAHNLRNIVFYYGESPSVALLSHFDVAVLEPGEGFHPPRRRGQRTRWLAYVSVGEVEPSRSYRADIPPEWLIGRNTTWKADIIDQAAPGWPDFLVSRVLTPLWEAGYRGFFLDTLDSYHLLGEDATVREQQRQGLVRVIHRIRQTFPGAMVILNRGFELLPEVHAKVNAVAFESLFQGWDQNAGRYVLVGAEERNWLLARAREVKAWHLPAIAIDYCAPEDTACTTRTAARIRALGIVPYIGDGHLLKVNRLLMPKH